MLVELTLVSKLLPLYLQASKGSVDSKLEFDRRRVVERRAKQCQIIRRINQARIREDNQERIERLAKLKPVLDMSNFRTLGIPKIESSFRSSQIVKAATISMERINSIQATIPIVMYIREDRERRAVTKKRCENRRKAPTLAVPNENKPKQPRALAIVNMIRRERGNYSVFAFEHKSLAFRRTWSLAFRSGASQVTA